MKILKKIALNFGIFLAVCLILLLMSELAFRILIQYKGAPNVVDMQIFEANEMYVWGHHPNTIYDKTSPIISINSLGFRDEEIEITKPENTKRILVLGDSFTFGIKAEQEWIFTEVLEDKLNNLNDDFNYEVINAGTIGYTIDNQYLLLKEKGLQLDLDMVVIMFFVGNDVTELRRHEWITDENGDLIRIVDTQHYVDEKRRLRSKENDEPISYFINFVHKRLIILQKKLGLYNDPEGEPTLTWPAFLEPDDPHGDPRLPMFWDQIDSTLVKIKEELDKRNIKLTVVAIPMDVQTDKKYWGKYSEMYFDDEAYEKNRPQQALKKLTDKYEIDFIDLLPYFRNVENHIWLYFEKEDPHFTFDGHKRTAEILFDNLQL